MTNSHSNRDRPTVAPMDNNNSADGKDAGPPQPLAGTVDLDQVLRQFRDQGWFLSADGVKQLSDDGRIGNFDQLLKLAQDTDLREISNGGPLAPDRFKPSKLELPAGGVMLQVQKVRNVAAPQANEESRAAPRMLLLELTDGHSVCSGFEYESIAGLRLDMAPGTKLRLRGAIRVAGGFLQLGPANVVTPAIGHVAALAERWEHQRALAKYAKGAVRPSGGPGGPPPWVPFGQRGAANGPAKANGQPIDEKFRSLASKAATSSGELDSKESAEFKKMRSEAIAAALRQKPAKRVFGGGRRQMVDHNLKKICDKGFTEDEAKQALKHANNNLERAMGNLKRDRERMLHGADAVPYERPERGGRSGRGRGGRGAPDEIEAKPSAPVSLFDFLTDKIPAAAVKPAEPAKAFAAPAAQSSRANDQRPTSGVGRSQPSGSGRPSSGQNSGGHQSSKRSAPQQHQQSTAKSGEQLRAQANRSQSHGHIERPSAKSAPSTATAVVPPQKPIGSDSAGKPVTTVSSTNPFSLENRAKYQNNISTSFANRNKRQTSDVGPSTSSSSAAAASAGQSAASKHQNIPASGTKSNTAPAANGRQNSSAPGGKQSASATAKQTANGKQSTSSNTNQSAPAAGAAPNNAQSNSNRSQARRNDGRPADAIDGKAVNASNSNNQKPAPNSGNNSNAPGGGRASDRTARKSNDAPHSNVAKSSSASSVSQNASAKYQQQNAGRLTKSGVMATAPIQPVIAKSAAVSVAPVPLASVPIKNPAARPDNPFSKPMQTDRKTTVPAIGNRGHASNRPSTTDAQLAQVIKSTGALKIDTNASNGPSKSRRSSKHKSSNAVQPQTGINNAPAVQPPKNASGAPVNPFSTATLPNGFNPNKIVGFTNKQTNEVAMQLLLDADQSSGAAPGDHQRGQPKPPNVRSDPPIVVQLSAPFDASATDAVPPKAPTVPSPKQQPSAPQAHKPKPQQTALVVPNQQQPPRSANDPAMYETFPTKQTHAPVSSQPHQQPPIQQHNHQPAAHSNAFSIMPPMDAIAPPVVVQHPQLPAAGTPASIRAQFHAFNGPLCEKDVCFAKYWEDGRFYHAEVTGVSDCTCVVQFLEYGNYEEVLFDDCLPVTDANLMLVGQYNAAIAAAAAVDIGGPSPYDPALFMQPMQPQQPATMAMVHQPQQPLASNVALVAPQAHQQHYSLAPPASQQQYVAVSAVPSAAPASQHILSYYGGQPAQPQAAILQIPAQQQQLRHPGMAHPQAVTTPPLQHHAHYNGKPAVLYNVHQAPPQYMHQAAAQAHLMQQQHLGHPQHTLARSARNERPMYAQQRRNGRNEHRIASDVAYP